MYIRNDKGEDIDFSDYTDVDVKPGENSSWQLIAKSSIDESELYIAAFEKVSDANAAKTSLGDAITNGEAWDANEFKESLKPAVYVGVTESKIRF